MINPATLLKLPGVKRYARDTVIIPADAGGDDMFVVLYGSLGVYKNHRLPGETLLETIGPGGFWGEMALFLGQPRAGTLVAEADSVALTINRRSSGELFAARPDLVSSLMEGMCKKLDAKSSDFDKLLIEYKRQTGTLDSNTESVSSDLFPEGHGSYLLALNNSNAECLFEHSVTCPVCGASFKSLMLITSKLRREGTDNDLRVRYKDIEPLHYDIVTCPKCYYSSPNESFSEISKKMGQGINEATAPFRGTLPIKEGYERDTFTVFAGYYLAMRCAPICVDDHRLTLAGYWQKLSRLYKDCDDNSMYLYASEQALDEYRYAYQNYRISEKQSQQICFIIGDLYHRLGDSDNARQFFYAAKTNKSGTAVLIRLADNRLEEIKEQKTQGKQG